MKELIKEYQKLALEFNIQLSAVIDELVDFGSEVVDDRMELQNSLIEKLKKLNQKTEKILGGEK